MAKWVIPHFKGKTEVLPDGSKIVDGVVETDDAKEPKASKIIREYYGAVKFENPAQVTQTEVLKATK